MIKQRYFLILILSLFFTGIHAQADSILSYEEYLKNVLEFHPLARQAQLKRELAEAEWRSARGSFDPVLSSNWNQKNFDDKLYYRQFQGKIQVPTRSGIDLVGGYENTDGIFLNPENTLDRYGLWNIGVEANLLQGLFVNERTTKLRQAKVFQDITENQRQIILSELVYSASLAYLNWQQYDAIKQVIQEGISVANIYFENTKQSYQNGEKTVIDTLEAFMILQDRNLLLQANEAMLLKARQAIENYLWIKDKTYRSLTEGRRPNDYQISDFQRNAINEVERILNNHPVLLEKQNKQRYFEIEQRFKREKLKPKLKVKYNPLLATSSTGLNPNFSSSNFKWGFNFSFPLLLRTERAAIQKGSIKLENIDLDLRNKRNELRNKLENNLAQQQNLALQFSLQENNLAGYLRLLEAENEKFLFGESSVFLLNKRQEKYINGQVKLIKLNIQLKLEQLNFLFLSNQIL